MPYSLANEAQLLRQLSEGDHSAYATLYRFYPSRLRRLLRMTTHLNNQDIEDLVQYAFMHIWENRDEMYLVKSFGAYLNRVVRNMYCARLRKQAVHAKVHKALRQEGPPLTNDTENELQFNTYYQKTIEAIGLLPERRRIIFTLRWQGYSRKETAGKLGISEKAVKTQLELGKAFIIDHLRKHGEWLLLLLIRILYIYFLPGGANYPSQATYI